MNPFENPLMIPFLIILLIVILLIRNEMSKFNKPLKFYMRIDNRGNGNTWYYSNQEFDLYVYVTEENGERTVVKQIVKATPDEEILKMVHSAIDSVKRQRESREKTANQPTL